MTRHTREQVDSSLEWEAELRGDADPDDCDEAWQLHLCRLAAEVRALRLDLAAVTYSDPVEGYAIVKGPHGTESAEELLREFGRRSEEIERLKAELERVSGGRMRDLLTDAEELCAKRTRQFRELREAAEALCKKWNEETDGRGWGGVGRECAGELRELLAKVKP